MSGHPHWQGQAPAEPGRSGFMSAPASPRGRSRARSRRGMIVFALALAMALGPVLMTIAASSVQAMPDAAVFSAKSDDWVGLAAIGSVLVCALLGMAIVRRYTSLGPRDDA